MTIDTVVASLVKPGMKIQDLADVLDELDKAGIEVWLERCQGELVLRYRAKNDLSKL